ncbi:hypothetical protein AUEXF2481DRAFT_59198, partial [Aureobasidium subglaciale EXF-2481]
MSHCHDEHEGHGHAHGHSHGAHDHSDDITPALQNSLYQQIDFDAINTLNELSSGSGSKICKKTWDERLSTTPELCSDADEQLLMHIPFTAQIRLHSIIIRTSTSPSAPLTLHLFPNRDDLDFSLAAEITPTQTLSLSQTNQIQEIPIKRALFNTVRSLDLFFEDNWSRGEEDTTRITYLGFKGEWMALNREPINFVYEAAANPSDHKIVEGVRGGVGSRLG